MRDEWREITNYWGEDSLIRIHKERVEGSGLPSETIEYLDEIGVVRSSRRLAQSLGIKFDTIGTDCICRLDEYFADERTSLDANASWIVIGHCFETLLCIESGEAAIIRLDGTPESGFLKWFVNSSLWQFMYCLTRTFQTFDIAYNSGGDVTFIHNLVEELAEIDVQAFSKNTNWWPIILNEIEHGQM